MPQGSGQSFTRYRRISSAKANEFGLIKQFNLGYRNREDVTNLPPQTLVVGSHDVLTNVSGRIGVRKGYTLDGAASTNGLPILSSYDYEMHTGTIQHLRAGFLTNAATSDGKLQFRYVNSANAVTWTNLVTGLSSVAFNFTEYWDNTNLQSLLLFVNGASSITEWTGGVTTFASATANTITKQGTTTWAQDGFYTTGTHTVVIAGVAYGATGGWGTLTLTGVAPNPSTPGYAVATEIHQKPETTLNSAITSLPSTLTNSLIANLRNQIYIGSFTNQNIYVSKVNNYKDFSFTTPTRVVGEGALVTLDGSPTALIPQEDQMYISAGKDQWYLTKFTLSADLTKEAFQVDRLKTTAQQASQSQGLTTKIGNDIAFVSNEPILQTLGRVDNVVLTPQLTDLSHPIVNDFNGYDFTSGHVFYYRKFIYVSIPTSSTVRVYNLTDPNNRYWEAPLTLPISCFSIINGDLYGHSYLTSETYKLFSGYNDNGNFISASATFAFNNFGQRPTSKGFNEYYVEGYISSNTTLNLGLQYDIDGCATVTQWPILGSDTRIVCIGTDDNSLGKNSLGKEPLGAEIATSSANSLPPKFRVIKTFSKIPFYEYQVSFFSSGVDQQWEILSFGAAVSPTSEGNVKITE